jgi:cytochrome c oxidase cbb3-type subunit III
MAEERDELLESNYDGIQEYDNDLPRWWLYLFYVTIIFAFGYVIYAHGGYSESATARLDRNMAELAALKQAAAPKAAPASAGKAELLALTRDPAALAAGKDIFQANCTPCHGQDGQGIIGPNLTDKYWLHGGKITDLQRTVTEGVVEKGMISWKPILSAQQIDQVIAYVWTLYGTNPAGAKEPQGQLEERENE